MKIATRSSKQKERRMNWTRKKTIKNKRDWKQSEFFVQHFEYYSLCAVIAFNRKIKYFRPKSLHLCASGVFVCVSVRTYVVCAQSRCELWANTTCSVNFVIIIYFEFWLNFSHIIFFGSSAFCIHLFRLSNDVSLLIWRDGTTTRI